MLNSIKDFHADEDGAVTLDRVIPTGGSASRGNATHISVSSSAKIEASHIDYEMQTAVQTISFYS
jgi:hypothetical protein